MAEENKLNINEMSPEDRARLLDQLTLAKAKSVEAKVETLGALETAFGDHPVKHKPDEQITGTDSKSASNSKEATVAVQAPATPQESATGNLSNFLTLINEGQFIDNSGRPLTDIESFVDQLNKKMLNPTLEDLDPNNKHNKS